MANPVHSVVNVQKCSHIVALNLSPGQQRQIGRILSIKYTDILRLLLVIHLLRKILFNEIRQILRPNPAGAT
jgi:hypothetical protein